MSRRGSSGNQKTCCAWCEDNRKDLRYTITVGHARKEFCSEHCLNEFKRVYLKLSSIISASSFDVLRNRLPAPCARL